MHIHLTEQDALALYRILLRWENTERVTVQEEEERQLLWDLQCLLEKELEPVDKEVRRRLVSPCPRE